MRGGGFVACDMGEPEEWAVGDLLVGRKTFLDRTRMRAVDCIAVRVGRRREGPALREGKKPEGKVMKSLVVTFQQDIEESVVIAENSMSCLTT
jgi:hypothetical protein